MATSEKRSGSYSTRVSLTDPLTGQRSQKRVTARTKRELDAKVADLKARWNIGTFIEPDETRLAAYVTEWLAKSGGSDATRLNRAQHVRLHVEPDPIGKIPIGRLKLAHVQDYIDRKIAAGFKPSYIKLIVGTINRSLARAVALRTIDHNPCHGVTYPHQARTTAATKVLSADESRTLVAGVADEDDGALWILAVTLGLRAGELLALRWPDVDFERGTLSVNGTITRNVAGEWIVSDKPKTESSRRTIHLPAVCLTALRAHRRRQLERRLGLGSVWQDTGAVFDRGDGAHHWDHHRIGRRWVAARSRLGLPAITMHGLRHTAATNALTSGMPVHVVSRMLGHSNPAITLRVYAHVLPTMEREAISRLDALYA